MRSLYPLGFFCVCICNQFLHSSRTCSDHRGRQREHARPRHLPRQKDGRRDDAQAVLPDVIAVVRGELVLGGAGADGCTEGEKANI